LTRTNLKFSKDHEWIKVEGDVATVGISDYAQKELGDVVYVELPTEGDSVNPNDPCSNIESVKAVSDVYSPVSGEITEVNKQLEDQPENVNKDPYGDGWIFKVKISDSTEADALMDEGQYQEYLKGLAEE